MDRLTIRTEDEDRRGIVYVKNSDYVEAAHRLAAYEDADEQGLLVRLPCKIGDKLYELIGGLIVACEVTGFRIGVMMDEDIDDVHNPNEWHIEYECDGAYCSAVISEFGTTLFLTYDSANERRKRD